MYLIIVYFLLQKFQLSCCIFPEHIDLQKIGEAKFNDEVYNVLKPSWHKITDHFKDFVLRRDTVKIPNERIFLDNNGFRHFWSSYSETYRKSSGAKVDSKLDKVPLVDLDFKVSNDTKSKNNTVKAERKVNNDSVTRNTTVNAILNANDTSATNVSTAKVTRHPKRKPRFLPQPEKNLLRPRPLTELRQGKTIAKTSFFCPFFGVITMTSFLD